MSDDSESVRPLSGWHAVGRRTAPHYLSKVRGYIEAYERGGEERERALAAFDRDWVQIQRFQGWAVEFCEVDALALEICHLFAERGALLLPLMSSEQAILWLEPAIAAARKLRLPHAELAHRRNLGLIYDRAGRYEDALANYRAALDMATEQGSLQSRADLLHRIGKVHRNLGKGRAPEAERWYRDALEAMLEAGDLCGEARVRIDLGNVRANQGYYTQALEQFAPARDLLARPECGDTRDEAMLLGYLGNANRNLGRYQEAERAYQAAVAMATALRERKMLAEHHFNLALLYRDVGRLDAMYQQLDESQRVAQLYNGERDKAKVQNGFGAYHALRGDFARAVEHHDAAIASFERAAAHFLADYARADKGRTLLMAGRYAEALAHLRPAVGGPGQHPLHRQQRGALVAQAHLLLHETAAAIAALAEARALDGDPNTVASRHRTAVLHGVALALGGAPEAAEALEHGARLAGERVAADSWELGAVVSRGLAAVALALLADGPGRAARLRDGADDLGAALGRCEGPGFRAELGAMLGLLQPLDAWGALGALRADLERAQRS